MIPHSLVAEVKRLLAQPALSQRQIARLTGVSRASVGAIASGRRRDYPERCDPRDCDDEPPQGPAERCPTCGGMVYAPCRLCRIRAIKAEERRQQRNRAEAGASWDPAEMR